MQTCSLPVLAIRKNGHPTICGDPNLLQVWAEASVPEVATSMQRNCSGPFLVVPVVPVADTATLVEDPIPLPSSSRNKPARPAPGQVEQGRRLIQLKSILLVRLLPMSGPHVVLTRGFC